MLTPGLGIFPLSQRARILTLPARYGLAVLITALCLALRLALQPVLHTEAPFITFYIGNVVSAVYLGFGPAVLATLAGAGATSYFFIPPLNSFVVAEHTWAILYALVSLTVIVFIEREHRAHETARHATQLAEERYAAVLRETTAKEAAQRSEERQRRWAEVTLSSIGDAVISTDAEGLVTFLNPVAEALTGWNRGDALGRPIQEVFDIRSEHTGQAAAMPFPRC